MAVSRHQVKLGTLPMGTRFSFFGWKGSLVVIVLGRALKWIASSCCFCSSFTCRGTGDVSA